MKTHPSVFPRFDTMPECDEQTDRHTDGFAVVYTALAARSKNQSLTAWILQAEACVRNGQISIDRTICPILQSTVVIGGRAVRARQLVRNVLSTARPSRIDHR